MYEQFVMIFVMVIFTYTSYNIYISFLNEKLTGSPMKNDNQYEFITDSFLLFFQNWWIKKAKSI